MAAEVWQRIALVEAESLNRTGAWATINAWFSRPSFAVMFVASCALLGLFLAEVRVNRLQRERSTQLARSYVQLIDPLIRSDLVARTR
jgi:type VI protein secretion system component VasK